MDTQKIQEKDYEIQAEKSAFGATASHRLRLADLLKLSLRVFRVRPARTFLTILGIAVGIGTVLFLVSLGYGLQYILIGKLATTEDSLITLEAFYPAESTLPITEENLRKMAVLPGAEEISPVAEFTGEVKIKNMSGFMLVKIVTPNYFRLEGLTIDVGSGFTEREPAAILSASALKLFNLKNDPSALGDTLGVKIFSPESAETGSAQLMESQPLVVKGITGTEVEPPFVIVPADAFRDPPPTYGRIFVKAKDIESVESLRDKIINDGYVISARIDLVNQAQRILTAITVILGVFGVAALVVSAIGMFNTMIIGFLERIFEVGIMKSLGASAKDIRNLFLMESLVMGLMGGVGGIILGVVGGELFNLGLNFLARYLGGKPITLFIYPWKFILFIIALSVVVGLTSGFWPARRAAKLPPKEAFIRK